MKIGFGVREKKMLADLGRTPADFTAECSHLLDSYHEDFELRKSVDRKDPTDPESE